MPGLQDTRRGILQTQINRCTSNVTPSPCFRRDDNSYVISSRLLQRRQQILDQIVAVFEAGREPDKTLADPEFGARLWRQPLMRGGRRMGDEALGVAEIVGNPPQLQPVESAERRRLAALDLE